jgi:Ca2+:H+ antiporter
MTRFFKPSLDWLLIFVPITLLLEFARPELHTAIFVCASIAIIPVAGWLGKATEHLAEKTNEGVGGLLNASFGNAAELIIALSALSRGLFDVVKASLTGSIIGNVLLVLGAAFLAGGIKHPLQRFNASAARAQAAMLTLSAISLVVPAAFHYLGGAQAVASERSLSLEISIVLIICYAASLWFSLKTHKDLFLGERTQQDVDEHGQPWSLRKSLLILLGATATVAVIGEILVAAVEPAAREVGMPSVFIGVIVVAVVGNAAEHSSAISMAMKNRMDLALGISIGSSVQIALFVAPLLVFNSYFVGPAPMDLVFTPAEVLAVFLAVLITYQVVGDGESNWLEGVQLLAVYAILAIIFFFLPSTLKH